MSIQIYCTPGDLAACWAQKWNCTPEVIEEVFGFKRALTDRETTYHRIIEGIKTLKARGYRQAEYCADCGYRIMEHELAHTA